MIIPDPPPTYTPTSRTRSTHSPTLLGLPSHLLLQILSHLSLPTLALSVRRTNRELYLFSMSLLRERLWPVWKGKVRQGNSTDARGMRRSGGQATLTPPPVPSKGPSKPGHKSGNGAGASNATGSATRSSRSSTLSSMHEPKSILYDSHETAALDLFILSIAYSYHLSNESELMMIPSTSESAEHDLFDLLQPQNRTWDLVETYGLSDGLVVEDGTGYILKKDISVTMSGKTFRVLLPFASVSGKSTVKKGVVETKRMLGESLEAVADRLVTLVADEISSGRLKRTESGAYAKG